MSACVSEGGTKALWLIVPPAFVLGLIALILRHRVAVRQAENGIGGDLVYTIHRDGDDKLHVYRHGPALDREPALLLLDQPNGGDAKHGSAMTPSMTSLTTSLPRAGPVA